MIERILAALECDRLSCQCHESVRRGRGLTHCPSHADPNPSCNVEAGDDGKPLVYCHGGCDQKDVISALREKGLWRRQLTAVVNDGVPFANDSATPSSERREVATYDYTDRGGNLLFQVVRYQPKDFRQRRPDGNGGWIQNLDGVTRVLYRLPEVLVAVARKERVYLVEGERDVESLRAIGCVATTSPMGAGKWDDRYCEPLIGADVVIVADKDEPGRAHARQVAQSLSVAARSVRIIEMPDA